MNILVKSPTAVPLNKIIKISTMIAIKYLEKLFYALTASLEEDYRQDHTEEGSLKLFLLRKTSISRHAR